MNPGFVDGWIDFNADGDWADAGEHVFEDLGIEPEDPVTLAIFCHMNAQEAGELT